MVKKSQAEQTNDQLRQAYGDIAPKAIRLEACLREQIQHLLDQHEISLGVPMETRVKSLTSVIEKIKNRKKAKRVEQLSDLVGIRCILLFASDVRRMDEIVRQSFDVVTFENVAERLSEDQFGYQSNHYIVKLPDAWLKLPSNSGLEKITAEIQIRTVAQHIWAAASHKLQYKQEDNVPTPLRRSLSRVAALLEVIDSEFERFLEERNLYIDEIESNKDSSLDVDVLRLELERFWPSENKKEDGEPFARLLSDLKEEGIETVFELRDFLNNWKNAAMKEEVRYVAEYRAKDEDDLESWIDRDRLARGVYFSHVGLTRIAMSESEKAEKGVKPSKRK